MADALQPYVTACPVGCDASLATTDIQLPEGALRRCAACGQLLSAIAESGYWHSMQQFNQHDFNQVADAESNRRFNIARRRLQTISGLLGKTAREVRALDVGCSRGNFLAAGARLGFQMEGVEPAATVAAAARAAGHTVHIGLLDQIALPSGSFDAITLFEVVEHLKDPLPLLRECRRVLKPGGVLVVSTGNTASWSVAAMRERWDYFHIAKDGGHISFFNPRSIALLAARAGFRVEHINTARVKFFEKSDVSRWRYITAKLLAEMLNVPARICGRGHDMVAYLRVDSDSASDK
jgi:2-polyprenyl-3-methyl-5-hydroxy-6-metoxy-1,4-benzoquinol methylase